MASGSCLLAAGATKVLGAGRVYHNKQACMQQAPAWGRPEAWVGTLGYPPCRHQQVPARKHRRSRRVTATVQLSQQPQQVLDMDYMRRIYKETQLRLPDDGVSPLQRTINVRMMQQLQAQHSISQLQRLVSKELLGMSPQNIATALIIAVYGPLPSQQSVRHHGKPGGVKQQSEAFVPAEYTEATGEGLADAGAGPTATEGKDQQPNWSHKQWAQQKDWHRIAPSLVEALIVHLAEGLQRKQFTVHVSQVVTAALCAGRLWGRSTTVAGRQPTTEATNPSSNGAAGIADMSGDNGLVVHHRPAAVDAALYVLLQHAQASLFLCTPAELSRLGQGLGYLQLTNLQQQQSGTTAAGTDTWVSSFVKVTQSKMFQMDASQLSVVAWSVARLGYQPNEYWLSSLLSATQPGLSHMDPVQLTNLLWAICKWRHDPGDEWRAAAWAAVAAAVSSMSPKCLVAAITAVRQLQSQPPVAVLRACTARLVQVSDQMTPAQDCQVLHAYLGSGHLPDESHFVAYIQAMQTHLQRATAQQLAALLWTLARIGFLPSEKWRDKWVRAARANVRHMQGQDIAHVLGAFVRWRPAAASFRPPRQLVQDLCELMLAQARAEQLSARTAGQLLWCMTQLRIPPPRQLLRELLLLLGSEARLQAEDNAANTALRPFPADLQQGKLRPPALVTASILGDAVISLPNLLQLYDRQQLLQNQQVVAVVMAGDGQQAAGSGSLNGTGHPHQLQVPDLHGVLHVNGTPQPALQPGPLPWHVDTAEQHQQAQKLKTRRPASGKAAAPSKTKARHKAAEVVDLLLPAAVAVPLLRAVQDRLHLMDVRQLILLIEALAEIRLAPGRQFLLAHVRAIAPHLAAMTSRQKLRVDAAYQILSQDPSCVELDDQDSAQRHI